MWLFWSDAFFYNFVTSSFCNLTVFAKSGAHLIKCPKNMSEAGYRCVSLNARSIVNKKNELNIMVEDIDPHIIDITESWANTDITVAELGLTGNVMFRRD